MGRNYFIAIIVACQLTIAPSDQGRQIAPNNTLTPDTAAVNSLNRISEGHLKQFSDSAFFFARKVLKITEQMNYPAGRAAAYMNIAKMYYQKGDYLKSLKNVLNALSLNNKINNAAGQADAYNLLALIYLAQNNTGAALKEFKQAELINHRLNNKGRLAANYFNQGLAYLQVRRRDSASYYLSRCKTTAIAINDQHMLAMVNNRLGDYYMQCGETGRAINFYVAVAENKTYQNDWENSFALTGLAECYFKKEQYIKAIAYGEQGLKLARKNRAKWDIERALNVLYQSNQALEQWHKAYQYLLMDKRYNDSLFDESKQKEINGLYLKQKQAENEALLKKNQLIGQENKTNRAMILIASLCVVFLFIIVMILYRNYTRQGHLNDRIKQQNQELEELNQSKNQLFAVISHDLRSPFTAILGTLTLLKDEDLNAEEKKMIFNSFASQLTATAAMLENLLLWAGSQQKVTVTKIECLSAQEITEQVLAVFKPIALEKQIHIDHELNPQAMLAADRDQLRIILQNLIANAIKFTRRDGHIRIGYELTESKVRVMVYDNGIGMSEEKLKRLFHKSGKAISTYGTSGETGTGIGLTLVKQFAEQNNATISVSSQLNQGTTFEMEFARCTILI